MPLLTYEEHIAIMEGVEKLKRLPKEEIPYTGWKITEEKVRFIRASEKTTKDLAKELGVCYRTVLEIRHGKTWKHVK